MIARANRMAISDFVLVAVAVLILVLSLGPGKRIRQNVVVRDPQGITHRYSFDVDDPRLAKLDQQLQRWKRRPPDAETARHRWIVRAAEHYAELTKPVPQARPVVPVSFTLPPDDSDAAREANEREAAKVRARQRQAESAMWIRVAAEAKSRATQIERHHQRAISFPPIVLGSRFAAGPTRVHYLVGCLAGLLVAIAFSIWTRLCPALRLQGEAMAGDRIELPDGSQLLRLEIPTTWVRLRQPLSVWVRRLTYAATLTAGVIAALLG